MLNIAGPPPTSSRLLSSTTLPASKFPASSLSCCCCCWRNYRYRHYSLAEPPRRGFSFLCAPLIARLSVATRPNGQPVARFLCCVVGRRTTNDQSFRASARNRAQFGIDTCLPPLEEVFARFIEYPIFLFNLLLLYGYRKGKQKLSKAPTPNARCAPRIRSDWLLSKRRRLAATTPQLERYTTCCEIPPFTLTTHTEAKETTSSFDVRRPVRQHHGRSHCLAASNLSFSRFAYPTRLSFYTTEPVAAKETRRRNCTEACSATVGGRRFREHLVLAGSSEISWSDESATGCSGPASKLRSRQRASTCGGDKLWLARRFWRAEPATIV